MKKSFGSVLFGELCFGIIRMVLMMPTIRSLSLCQEGGFIEQLNQAETGCGEPASRKGAV